MMVYDIMLLLTTFKYVIFLLFEMPSISVNFSVDILLLDIILWEIRDHTRFSFHCDLSFVRHCFN